MKYLGIDYGKRKIGTAISDDSGKIAFPRVIMENRGTETIDDLKKIILEEKIGGIVVGKSLDFLGNENAVMKPLKEFVALLEDKTGIEVQFEAEYLSSVQASRIINNKDDDSRAASIVLQSYLDKINNLK